MEDDKCRQPAQARNASYLTTLQLPPTGDGQRSRFVSQKNDRYEGRDEEGKSGATRNRGEVEASALRAKVSQLLALTEVNKGHCSDNMGRPKQSTQSEQPASSEIIVKDVSTSLVSAHLPSNRDDDDTINEEKETGRGNETEEDISGDSFNDSLALHGMSTDATLERQPVIVEGNEDGIPSVPKEDGIPSEPKEDGIPSEPKEDGFASDQVKNGSPPAQNEDGTLSGQNEDEAPSVKQGDGSSPVQVENATPTQREEDGNPSKREDGTSSKSERSGRGHHTKDDNDADQAFQEQQSSSTPLVVSDNKQRSNKSLLSVSSGGEANTKQKKSNQADMPLIMMNNATVYQPRVARYSGADSQDFSIFVRSFEDASRFEGITEDAKKLNFFLTLLEDGPMDRAEEALRRKPDMTLAELIEELKLRFENPMFTMRFKEQLRSTKKQDNESVSEFYGRVTRMAKKATGGVYSDETKQLIMDTLYFGVDMDMRAFVQTKEPKSPEEYLEQACRYEMFRAPGFQARQTPTMSMPPELLTTLNRLADNMEQTRQWQVQSLTSHGFGPNQRYNPGWNQPLANQTMYEDSNYNRQNYYQYSMRHEPQQFQQFGGPNQTFNGDERNFGRNNGQRTGGNKSGIRCHYCEKLGHYASECLKKKFDRRDQVRQGEANTSSSSLDPVATHRQGPPTVQANDIQQIIKHYKQELRNKDEQIRVCNQRNEQLAAAQYSSSSGNQVMMLQWPRSEEEEKAVETGTNPQIQNAESSSFITAQVPVHANGYRCSALIATGANITVAGSEAATALGRFRLDPPQSASASGLGDSLVSMKGSGLVMFQIGSLKIWQRVHLVDGPCTSGQADSYLFILGNDVLSRLPRFFMDYGRGQFHVGKEVLPMGRGVRGRSNPLQVFSGVCFVHDSSAASKL
ncbi:unnamed protein product [Caenorhabditis nigoni]